LRQRGGWPRVAGIMKHLLCLAALLLFLVSIQAADHPQLAALKAADDERVAVILKADAKGLAAILSDDLRYAHSSGSVDTKASFTEAVVSGRSKYTQIKYDEREFTFPAAGMALMTGRAQVKVGGNDMVLSYLAVWREEKGKWRFLAWQSCKMAPPAAK
jgi:hypothetical protein